MVEQYEGTSVGAAQVSEKHAGFLINRGGATCDDMSAQENLKLLLLSPQRRTVYIMSRFQGKTAPEISEELCLSRRTIENHLLASRKEIREYIKSCI